MITPVTLVSAPLSPTIPLAGLHDHSCKHILIQMPATYEFMQGFISVLFLLSSLKTSMCIFDSYWAVIFREISTVAQRSLSSVVLINLKVITVHARLRLLLQDTILLNYLMVISFTMQGKCSCWQADVRNWFLKVTTRKFGMKSLFGMRMVFLSGTW